MMNNIEELINAFSDYFYNIFVSNKPVIYDINQLKYLTFTTELNLSNDLDNWKTFIHEIMIYENIK